MRVEVRPRAGKDERERNFRVRFCPTRTTRVRTKREISRARLSRSAFPHFDPPLAHRCDATGDAFDYRDRPCGKWSRWTTRRLAAAKSHYGVRFVRGCVRTSTRVLRFVISSSHDIRASSHRFRIFFFLSKRYGGRVKSFEVCTFVSLSPSRSSHFFTLYFVERSIMNF